MNSSAITSAASYSDLPTLCIPVICRQLGQSGPQPILRVRTVNQDFHDHSAHALADSILRHLKTVNFRTTESPAERLRIVGQNLTSMTNKHYLPEPARLPILLELCRIVSSLTNKEFNAGWRALVAQFNAESDVMRSQLQPAMDRCGGNVELYGDGGVDFAFKTPAW